MPIKYAIGDATNPIRSGDNEVVILNLLSDLGVWGAGFHKSIDRSFGKGPRQHVLDVHSKRWLALGSVLFIRVAPDIRLANLVAVRGLRSPFSNSPVDYDALRTAMRRMVDVLPREGVEFHSPRLGKSPQNANWNTVSQIIEEVIVSRGYEVTVYDLKESKNGSNSASGHR